MVGQEDDDVQQDPGGAVQVLAVGARVVGALVVGDAVDGTCVVGALVVGDTVAGTCVVGALVVGDAAVHVVTPHALRVAEQLGSGQEYAESSSCTTACEQIHCIQKRRSRLTWQVESDLMSQKDCGMEPLMLVQ